MFDKMVHRDEFRLRILLTNKCNRSCSFCLNDFQDKNPETFADTDNIISFIKSYGSFMKSISKKSVVTFSGGEPGLHSDLSSILKQARAHCDIVKVVTNGAALLPSLCNFVDCWHVGTTYKNQSIIDFLAHSKNVIPQIVVTDQANTESLIDLVAYYYKQGLVVKLFTDFNSENQQELRMKIAYTYTMFDGGIITRFSGKQENRGLACTGCDRKCITLKALWVFPDGSSSTCPQKVKEIYNDVNYNKTIEKAYNAHLYKDN